MCFVSSSFFLKVPVYLRTNQHFRPPDDLSLPIIMVGPGTGVAPFVGFLKERSFLRQQAQASGQSYGETWLFYGCRNKELDFLFRYFGKSSNEQNINIVIRTSTVTFYAILSNLKNILPNQTLGSNK